MFHVREILFGLLEFGDPVKFPDESTCGRNLDTRPGSTGFFRTSISVRFINSSFRLVCEVHRTFSYELMKREKERNFSKYEFDFSLILMRCSNHMTYWIQIKHFLDCSA